jgi:hypothetical protein
VGEVAFTEFRKRSDSGDEHWQTNYVGSCPKQDCGRATGTLGEAEEGGIALVLRAKTKREREVIPALFFTPGV